MTLTFLRTCAICAGHHAGHNSNSLGGRYICPRHGDCVITGTELMEGDIVHPIDGPAEDLRVVETDGVTLTVRRIGEKETFGVSAWTVYRLEYPAGRRRP
jgi:hypothetical protein